MHDARYGHWSNVETLLGVVNEYLLKSSSDAAIAAAVQAERERCAKVAAMKVVQETDWGGSAVDLANDVIREIMKGPDHG